MGRPGGSTEGRSAYKVECLIQAGEVQAGQAAKMEVVPGLGGHTLLKGAGGVGGQGCLLPARWAGT